MKLKDQFLNTNWFSRKLIVCFVIEVLSTIFLFMGVFQPENWIEVTKWNVGLYMATNAGSKLANLVEIKRKD